MDARRVGSWPEREPARCGSETESDKAAHGLKTLYNCSTAEVEYAAPEVSKNAHELTPYPFSIVAVHGVNGHRESSFTAANSICWLRSLLPAQCPQIRVFSYGYDARTQSSSLLSREHLHDHAEQLIEELRRERMLTEVNIFGETVALMLTLRADHTPSNDLYWTQPRRPYY